MQYYFSATTGGFYSSEVHDITQLPADCVAVSCEHYNALMQGQAAGKQIAADPGNQPVLVDRQAPTTPLSERRARVLRGQALDATDWLVQRHHDEVALEAGSSLSASQYRQLQQYRQRLRDLPKSPGWPTVEIPLAPAFE